MTLVRIDPPIPLQTPRGLAYAHFLDDCGDERDAMWVCFCGDGQIWWFPNPQVRACRNFSLGRTATEEMKMAKNWIKGAVKHPGALRKSLGVKKGEKIPKGKLEKAEHSRNKTTAKRARLAVELGKFRRGKN